MQIPFTIINIHYITRIKLEEEERFVLGGGHLDLYLNLIVNYITVNYNLQDVSQFF